MARPTVEHDFFALERVANSQRSSIRGIQSAIQRMNPDLVRLRSVMENPRPPTQPPVWTAAGPNRLLTPSAPVLARSPSMLTTVSEGTAPLTIFYNGTVTVFHVGPAEAVAIMKVAAESNARAKPAKEGIVDKLTGDLPMARKMSLQIFLEKRKERMDSKNSHLQLLYKECWHNLRAPIARSNTSRNPGCLFWGCQLWKTNNCYYFQWLPEDASRAYVKVHGLEGVEIVDTDCALELLEKRGDMITRQEEIGSQAALENENRRLRLRVDAIVKEGQKTMLICLVFGILLGFILGRM